jgi:hypothetical protein
MSASASRRDRSAYQRLLGGPSRRLGQFGLTRGVLAGIWLLGVTVTALSVATAGQSDAYAAVGMVMIALFGMLAARCLRVGYVGAPQGLVVVGPVTTRVIPWRHITRIEASPHRWAAHGDTQTDDLAWVARVTYGPRECSPLFTVRSRSAAHKLAAILADEVRSRH